MEAKEFLMSLRAMPAHADNGGIAMNTSIASEGTVTVDAASGLHRLRSSGTLRASLVLTRREAPLGKRSSPLR